MMRAATDPPLLTEVPAGLRVAVGDERGWRSWNPAGVDRTDLAAPLRDAAVVRVRTRAARRADGHDRGVVLDFLLDGSGSSVPKVAP